MLQYGAEPNATQVFLEMRTRRKVSELTNGVSARKNIELVMNSHSGSQPVLGSFFLSALTVSVISCSTISSAETSFSPYLWSSLLKFWRKRWACKMSGGEMLFWHIKSHHMQCMTFTRNLNLLSNPNQIKIKIKIKFKLRKEYPKINANLLG